MLSNFLAQLQEILATLQAIHAELVAIHDLLGQIQFPNPFPVVRFSIGPAQRKE